SPSTFFFFPFCLHDALPICLFFGQQESGGQTAVNSSGIALFPLGKPAWDIGIIITAILTGLLNTANTFGSLKGTDRFAVFNNPRSEEHTSELQSRFDLVCRL